MIPAITPNTDPKIAAASANTIKLLIFEKNILTVKFA